MRLRPEPGHGVPGPRWAPPEETHKEEEVENEEEVLDETEATLLG